MPLGSFLPFILKQYVARLGWNEDEPKVRERFRSPTSCIETLAAFQPGTSGLGLLVRALAVLAEDVQHS